MEEARKPDAMMENDQTAESLTASMTGNISTLQMSHYYNLSVGFFLFLKFIYQFLRSYAGHIRLFLVIKHLY